MYSDPPILRHTRPTGPSSSPCARAVVFSRTRAGCNRGKWALGRRDDRSDGVQHLLHDARIKAATILTGGAFGFDGQWFPPGTPPVTFAHAVADELNP